MKNVMRYVLVLACCVGATALMGIFTEGESPLALLLWMLFFVALCTPVWANAPLCARVLRRDGRG